jgi:DNA-directed RNA polymerase sigma subunit (sigma70/sigma32)
VTVSELPPPPPPAEESPRKPRVRARTISIKRLSKRELERGRLANPDEDHDRPATRGDCLQGEHSERPCPFVLVQVHHMYLDVSDRTRVAIKLNWPELEVWELPETCSLDVADRNGITLEDVADVINLTRERVRQLETRGLAKLKALTELAALAGPAWSRGR